MNEENTSKANYKTIAFIAVCVGIFAGLIVLSVMSRDPVKATRHTLSVEQASLPKGKPTVGSEWQWKDISNDQIKHAIRISEKKQQLTDTENSPINVVDIYHSLQDVKLDENGSLVIDDDALQALYRTLDLEEIHFNDAGLEELSGVIKVGLPGVAGEQTAEVVTNFYHYREAKKELDAVAGSPQTSEELRAYYENLVKLREQIIGYETAQKLFEKEDAQSRFMLESMILAKETDLSEEAREAKQQSLRKQYLEPDPEISNWDSRFTSYQNERQIILDAALEDAEKKQQVENLYKQYFSAEERAKISEMELDKIELE